MKILILLTVSHIIQICIMIYVIINRNKYIDSIIKRAIDTKIEHLENRTKEGIKSNIKESRDNLINLLPFF